MRRLWAVGLLAAAAALAQPAPQDTLLRAMADELERSRALRVVSVELPYYIEYALHDGETLSISASLGALVGTQRTRYRLPRIQVRTGDYKFDNTNWVGADFYGGTRYEVDQFPLDNSYPVLRQHLWLATDMAYKAALESYSRKRAALRNVTRSEELADFSRAAPVELVEPPGKPLPDEKDWTSRVRRLSAVFLKYPAVIRSTVDLEAGRSTQYLATSEGTRVRVPEGMFELRVRAAAQAPDGMLLRDAAMFHSLDPDGMPPEAELERGTRQVAENLSALAQAPVGEPYTGPVLFEGVAAAQLFAEVLGRNFAVPRKPVSPRPFPFTTSELEGRLHARILPEWMDVVDDPSQREWRGRPLFGHYKVDLEGVSAQPVILVEKGMLTNFLLTRQPVSGFSASNGHARLPGAFGAKAAGIGNLFVRASQAVPSAELKKKLIELCQARNKPFGLIVRKMDFPSTASFDEVRRALAGMGQSGGARPVSVPVLVARVYPDGREELVRGLRFRGLTVRSLKDILAASEESFVFDFLDNTAPFALTGAAGFVSEAAAIAPSVLIDDLELERAQEEVPKPPLVPAPPLVGRTPSSAAGTLAGLSLEEPTGGSAAGQGARPTRGN